ncbi:dihydroneopterin aldolase [Candidatus Bipolaricaulota bacterium]|nr:dihydroneopterin aldolase [Candidatus Bipolaricaulota bacterium]
MREKPNGSTDQDKIKINDLTIPCTVGTEDFEREMKQKLIVSLEIVTDATTAGITDDLGDTIDYSKLSDDIYEMVAQEKPYLIEAAAQQIARLALSFEGAREVTVFVQKPSALPLARSAEVEITRSA